MSPLIEASRAIRAQLKQQRTSPVLLAAPGLRAALPLVDTLLLQLEELADRVTILERAVRERSFVTGRLDPEDRSRISFELET